VSESDADAAISAKKTDCSTLLDVKDQPCALLPGARRTGHAGRRGADGLPLAIRIAKFKEILGEVHAVDQDIARPGPVPVHSPQKSKPSAR